jgi:hypothetical protein
MYRHTTHPCSIFRLSILSEINPISTPIEPQRDLYVLAVISFAFCLLTIKITHFLYSDVINKVMIELLLFFVNFIPNAFHTVKKGIQKL